MFRFGSSGASGSVCSTGCGSSNVFVSTMWMRLSGSSSGSALCLAFYARSRRAAGRLVTAAQAPPALLRWALPDLGSRFSASAIFQLRVLDEAEQQAALQLRARLRGFELPDETSRWLQRRYPRDMHKLYELLDTLDEAALVAQRRLTVPFIREVLGLLQADGQGGDSPS